MSEETAFKLRDSSSTTTLDWNKCFLCQKKTSEKLTCPAEFSDRFRGAGYSTLSKNLHKFEELGKLKNDLKLSHLNVHVEHTLDETLMLKHARFHKSCSLKYNDNEGS